MNGTDLPLLSVIVPFRDNHEELAGFNRSLEAQTYPATKIEIIFIDNSSSDKDTFQEAFIGDAILLREAWYPNSPYSARNRGIEAATGEILAFADANSTADRNWLEEGVRCLLTNNADLAAGDVRFDFENEINAAKIIDALTSINMKDAVEKRGAAFTANLLVKREVFDRIGLFEEGVRSGGDVRWTSRAVQNAGKIIYCENARVWKKARSYRELYRKKIRTGRGYVYTWLQETERKSCIYNLLRSLKPPAFNAVSALNPDRFQPGFEKWKVPVWFHLYIINVVQQLAFVFEYFRYRLGLFISSLKKAED